MSMLSAQCDELRSMAASVGLEVPQAATLMMEAADTITELRGALQVASVDYRHLQAENAKLRQENQSVGMAAYELGRARLADENAKLRKLAHKMWKPFCWAQSGCEVCLTDVQDAEIRDLALELGVEVDG